VYRIGEWFCCLTSEERAILRSCAEAFVLTVGVGIPCDVYSAFWVLVLSSREARKAAFAEIFGLTQVELEVGDPIETVCLWTFDDSAFWIALTAFILTPEGACLAGCERWIPS